LLVHALPLTYLVCFCGGIIKLREGNGWSSLILLPSRLILLGFKKLRLLKGIIRKYLKGWIRNKEVNHMLYKKEWLVLGNKLDLLMIGLLGIE
jgi:hypothetical protein